MVTSFHLHQKALRFLISSAKESNEFKERRCNTVLRRFKGAGFVAESTTATDYRNHFTGFAW